MTIDEFWIFFQERQDEAKQRVDIGKLSVVTDGIVERIRTLEERMSEDRIARVEQQLSLLTTRTHHATCLTMSRSSISGYGSQELLGSSSVQADSADSPNCACSHGKSVIYMYVVRLLLMTDGNKPLPTQMYCSNGVIKYLIACW